MAGWENSNEEIRVENVEEFVDTNPDLYKQRTIAALNEKRFKDALKEAQLALKYGNQALEYHVLIVRVLFEMGEYEVCSKYLTNSGIWSKRDDTSLLQEERNYIYYVYAVCYKGDNIAERKNVFVTADGRGMYTSLQQAIDRCRQGQEIVLIDGYYKKSTGSNKHTFSSGHTKFEEEKIYINSKEVVIKGLGDVAISTQMEINNAKVDISEIVITAMKDDKLINKGEDEEESIIAIKESRVKFEKVSLCGIDSAEREIVGILVDDNSEVFVNNCSFVGEVGVCAEDGNIFIDNCEFSCKNGAACISEYNSNGSPKMYIKNSEFYSSSSESIGMGIICLGGFIEVLDCDIHEIVVGICAGSNEQTPQFKEGECIIKNCKIHDCMGNITLARGGSMRIESSTISRGHQCGIKAFDNTRLELLNTTLKQNKKDIIKNGNPIIREVGVVRRDNDIVGRTVGATTNIGKGILKVAKVIFFG